MFVNHDPNNTVKNVNTRIWIRATLLLPLATRINQNDTWNGVVNQAVKVQPNKLLY